MESIRSAAADKFSEIQHRHRYPRGPLLACEKNDGAVRVLAPVCRWFLWPRSTPEMTNDLGRTAERRGRPRRSISPASWLRLSSLWPIHPSGPHFHPGPAIDTPELSSGLEQNTRRRGDDALPSAFPLVDYLHAHLPVRSRKSVQARCPSVRLSAGRPCSRTQALATRIPKPLGAMRCGRWTLRRATPHSASACRQCPRDQWVRALPGAMGSTATRSPAERQTSQGQGRRTRARESSRRRLWSAMRPYCGDELTSPVSSSDRPPAAPPSNARDTCFCCVCYVCFQVVWATVLLDEAIAMWRAPLAC